MVVRRDDAVSRKELVAPRYLARQTSHQEAMLPRIALDAMMSLRSGVRGMQLSVAPAVLFNRGGRERLYQSQSHVSILRTYCHRTAHPSGSSARVDLMDRRASWNEDRFGA